MKWSFASVALLALSVGTSSAWAEEVKRVTVPQPVNMTGAWNWEYSVELETPGGRPAGGVPTCDLVQTGTRISGDCRLNYVGKGPVIGTVDGDQVTLTWNFLFYEFLLTRPEVGGIYTDKHADVTFRGHFDANHVLHGRYRSENQFGWNRVFFARKAQSAPA